MFKIFIVLLWLTAAKGYFLPQGNHAVNCPPVSNVHKIGGTSRSFTFGWSAFSDADEYKVWYVRHEDQYTGPAILTTATDHTFSDLPNGTYTFFVAAICGAQTSDWLGVEEVING